VREHGPPRPESQITRPGALAVELDAHLDGDGEGNERNGSSVKTLNTEVGPVKVAVPRDRDGSFDPVLVPKQARRSDGLAAVIISPVTFGYEMEAIVHKLVEQAGGASRWAAVHPQAAVRLGRPRR